MGRKNGLLVMLLTLAAGCGPELPDLAEISAADRADPLTAGPGDKLFTLTLVEAEKSFVLGDLSISAGLPGQTATAVNFTHEDQNQNGLLDPGEGLTCTEPPVNLFDQSTVGKGVTVDLAERRDGMFFNIGSAVWTPAN